MDKHELIELLDTLLQNQDRITSTSIGYTGSYADTLTVCTEDGGVYQVVIR